MTEKRTGSVKPEPKRSTLGLVPPSRTASKPSSAAERAKANRPRPPRPRFRLTRRATILLLAVCAVVVTIAYPLQEYLAQRSQLAAIDAQNAVVSGHVTKLQQQIALWSDPGYVAIQARAQLHFVKPGEKGFTLPGTSLGDEQLGMPTPTASPWYDTLWGTVKLPGASSSASPTSGR